MSTVISFLSDFGTSDTSVGQCKGVIAGITPKALVVDITHDVPHYDIATGARLLRNATPHFPPCVHVAIVDPGVGTARRGVAIETGRGDILIGPDNGLLLAAAEALGGVGQVFELTNPEFRHHPVSHTFHARDIFCPAAAFLIHGVGIHMLGDPLDASTLVALPRQESSLAGGVLHAAVAYVNTYGTLALSASGTALDGLGQPTRVEVTVGNNTPFLAAVVRTFGEVPIGERLLFIDSYGQLSLAGNRRDLAAELGLARHDHPTVAIRAAETPA